MDRWIAENVNRQHPAEEAQTTLSCIGIKENVFLSFYLHLFFLFFFFILKPNKMKASKMTHPFYPTWLVILLRKENIGDKYRKKYVSSGDVVGSLLFLIRNKFTNKERNIFSLIIFNVMWPAVYYDHSEYLCFFLLRYI